MSLAGLKRTALALLPSAEPLRESGEPRVTGMPFRLDIVEIASSGLSPARLRTGRQSAGFLPPSVLICCTECSPISKRHLSGRTAR
jgi:hypothetical protein